MSYPMDALPPLRLLAAFAAVTRTGSIQAASVELNVTQPAVSQAIKQLEAHIGVRLLDRSRRPAQPTAAGRTLALAITEGLGRIEDAVEVLRLSEADSFDAVTVACSVGVATYWLMPRVAAFYRNHPDRTVNVVTTQSGAPDLGEGVDLAIRYGRGRWTDGVVTPLFDERVEPLCAPQMRARFDGSVPPGDVPLLHVRAPETSWITWPEYLEATGLPPVAARGQTFTNYVQATQAALDGHGMMLGWRSITGALAEAGHLVPSGLPSLPTKDAFYLVARPKRPTAMADTFATWLAGSVEPAP
ncbi:MAG: LysR substrate-binding domain-containing protein [Pseudomonadota bacterium]